MMAPFLSGVFAAVAVVQLALGAFFLGAALLRRDRAYGAFATLLVLQALLIGAFAASYVSRDTGITTRIALTGHVLGGLATALELDFAARFTSWPFARRLVPGAYVIAVALALLMGGTELLWPQHFQPGLNASGLDVHLAAQPHAPTAWLFLLLVIGAGTLSRVCFARALWLGARDIWPALAGAFAAPIALLHDWLAFGGAEASTTVFLMPLSFVAYGFGVAGTVLLRYSQASTALAEAATQLSERETRLAEAETERRQIESELDEKQQLAVVGELAAAIAHEVRNPLAVIVNAAASLRRAAIDETDKRMLLSIVDEEAARLNRLVTDLLRFARPVRLARVPVNLAELAEQVRHRLGDRHELEIDTPDTLTPLAADASLLRVGLENLVENACQAMPDGGVVRIRARNEHTSYGPAVAVEVIDSGGGMPPDVVENATRPFFTTRPSGTGLGLPIVSRIVRAHRGSLSISSEPGHGTTVTLVLPGIGNDRPSLPPN